MKTELRKSFDYGFVLTDQELQRIYDKLVQQMNRVTNAFTIGYEVKFANEVVAERTTLQEVLLEDNSGIWMTRALTITLADQSPVKDAVQISLKFQASDIDSISYSVVGDDQDWVYLTGVKLEEGINEVKKVPLTKMARDVGTFGVPYAFITAPLMARIVASLGVPDYNFCWGRYVKVFERRKSIVNFIIFGVVVTIVLGIIIGIVANYISAKIGIGGGH